MWLFGKKKEREGCQGCAACGKCNSKLNDAKTARIKILGGGCAKCNELEAVVVSALAQLGMDTEVCHVTDFAEIAAYGVMTTPALVIDEKVVCYGRVLKTEEAVNLIKNTCEG